jgi:hypothetical protein
MEKKLKKHPDTEELRNHLPRALARAREKLVKSATH